MATEEEIKSWHSKINEHLRSCVDFWLQHSIDKEHGGYYNNLDRDGSVYDTDKHVWLQGRQVWTLGRLYMDHLEYQTDDIFQAIECGAEFLIKYGRAPGDRIYFCLAEDGQPVKLQRKVFAECFYVMAMSEYARVLKLRGAMSKADEVYAKAIKQYRHVCRFTEDLTLVGQEPLPGARPSHSLAMPMILLNVICELRCYSGDATFEEKEVQRCLKGIKLHVHQDREMVLETVQPDGSYLDTLDGRLLNPGHAIEAAWFILDYNRRFGGSLGELTDLALDMLNWSYARGWDKQHGGIFYFMDANDRSPIQLEWSMKLWWVHNETMIAMLMAYAETKDDVYWKRFVEVANWTLDHFVDDGTQMVPEVTKAEPGGGWFGYLDRQGNVSQVFKGGPYKGFFHVPRCLHMCEQLLADMNL